MLDRAAAAGVILTMASKFRYVDDVARAKAIMASGLIGEVVLFENAFASRVPMGKRWNADPAISGGGVLIDNGTHSVDIMRYFLGSLDRVQVVEGKRVQGLPVEDTVHIFARSARGVMGSIDLSWSIHKELDSYIRIYGSEGTIAVGWRSSQYRRSSSTAWERFGEGYDRTAAFCRGIDNFVDAVRGDDELIVSQADAMASVEVIEAAYAAMHSAQWTSVRRFTVPAVSVA
jgi:predicted dehydrogenase